MKQDRQLSHCPRCGLKLSGEVGFCPACGFVLEQALPGDERGGRPGAPVMGQADKGGRQAAFPVQTSTGVVPDVEEKQVDIPIPRRSARNDIASEESFLQQLKKIFGWKSLTGVVVAIDPPYEVRPESSVLIMVIKGVLVIMSLPVVIAVAIGIQVASRMLTPMSIFKGGGSGFVGNLASQLIGFVIMGRLLGPKAQVSVRDIRLKTSEGREWLVRIRGELYAGSLGVGDDVTVEGFDRHGTLMFKRGSNSRTGGKIITRYR